MSYDPHYSVTLLDSLEALAPLATDWNQLAGKLPFRRWEWASTWWKHYQQPSRDLFVLAIHDPHGRLVGIAPWYRDHSPTWGRVIRFLGTGEVCADYCSLCCQPHDARPVASAVANWLEHEGRNAWDVLELSAVESSDEPIQCLRQEFGDRQHGLIEQDDARTWSAALPATWDEFLAQLSKSRRDRARSQLRKLADTGRAKLHRATSLETMREAFAILVELHQKRRGMLQQDGCFASPRFLAFHAELAERLLALQELQLQWIELDGRPVAVEYSFLGGDTVYYYQGGLEPEAAELQPGWLQLAMVLRQAIADGYRHYNFLRGDEPYKASWGATPKSLIQLRIAGARPTARVRHAAWQTRETVKRWAQSGRRLSANWSARRQSNKVVSAAKETSLAKEAQ